MGSSPIDNDNEEKVVIKEQHRDQPIVIKKHLRPKVKNQLLLANIFNVSAWILVDMTTILREFTKHSLGLTQYAPPVMKKRRNISLERSNSMTT